MVSSLELSGLLSAVRRLKIQSRKAAEEFMAGQFRSAFKGPGIEFDEVREYRPGDDLNRVDWNVSARFGSLHVKTFREERELCVLFLVDGSGSMSFGSQGRLKSETAAELCALLAFSALATSDRVGLILYTNRVERHLPPRKGQAHMLRLVRELLAFEPREGKTDTAAALEYAARVRRRRAVVFLVSDFLGGHFEKDLKRFSLRHDLIACRIVDPRELNIEGRGIVRLRDAERPGAIMEVDLDNSKFRQDFAQRALERDQAIRRSFARQGVDLVEFMAGRPCAPVLRGFFQRRLRRGGAP